MEINPLAATLAGRVDGPTQRPHAVDPEARKQRPGAVQGAGFGDSIPTGTVSSLANTSAEEFTALANAGQVDPNAPRGTYLNLLV